MRNLISSIVCFVMFTLLFLASVDFLMTRITLYELEPIDHMLLATIVIVCAAPLFMSFFWMLTAIRYKVRA